MIVALIGYGEVGRILAEDLRARSVAVSAYDLKLDGDRGQPLREHAAACDVVLAASHASAVHGVDLVVSAVTASQTVAAAQSVAPGLKRGAFFLDFNSASPGAKVRAAEIVNAAGGTLVLVCLITVLVGFLLFPEQIAQLTGSEKWLEALREAYPMFRQ